MLPKSSDGGPKLESLLEVSTTHTSWTACDNILFEEGYTYIIVVSTPIAPSSYGNPFIIYDSKQLGFFTSYIGGTLSIRAITSSTAASTQIFSGSVTARPSGFGFNLQITVGSTSSVVRYHIRDTSDDGIEDYVTIPLAGSDKLTLSVYRNDYSIFEIHRYKTV